MASKHKFNRKLDEYKIGLYGKFIKKSVAYCELHKCHLRPYDIHRKKCIRKKCKFLRHE